MYTLQLPDDQVVLLACGHIWPQATVIHAVALGWMGRKLGSLVWHLLTWVSWHSSTTAAGNIRFAQC